MQPFVHRVLHPTDLSEASERAFAHALAIALTRKAALTIFNASRRFDPHDWSRFPSVMKTLKRWGVLEADAKRTDVFRKLGVRVQKVGVDARDPVDAIVEFIEQHPADLMVVATEGRDGLPRFLRESVAQQAARTTGVRTIFVPASSPGFVSLEDGSLSLGRILLPVAENPSPEDAAELATRAAAALGVPPVTLHLVHVGENMPFVSLPESPDWTWMQTLRQGDPVEEILAVAREDRADLIIMATDGRDVLSDVFRGSHAERIVRAAPCPVGVIPVPKG